MNDNRNARELKAIADASPKVVGITGGIGSGKTVATDALKQAGFCVIDADEISRALFAPGTDGEKRILKVFPSAKRRDGSLNRKKLRDIISQDQTSKIKLNNLTHPFIINEIKRRLAVALPPVVLSAPLLLESALARLCDYTVCVYCPRNVKIARLTKRDGITRAQAEQIIDAQIPDTERCTLSDFIIPSDVPIEQFRAETVELFKKIFKISDN